MCDPLFFLSPPLPESFVADEDKLLGDDVAETVDELPDDVCEFDVDVDSLLLLSCDFPRLDFMSNFRCIICRLPSDAR